MIQPSRSRSRKSSFARRRTLFGGAAAVLFASSIAWGCGEQAPYTPPAGTTGGSSTTGGTESTGGVVSTGGTATGGTPATGGTTGGTAPTTGGTAPTTGGTSSTGGTPAVPACVSAIVTGKCTVCHFAGAPVSFASLDLSGDFVPRILDKNATFGGVTDMSGCPTGAKLIDSTTPENSWFLKKLNGGQGTCGTAMPQTGPLTADEKTCVQNWIQMF